jgi:hypothetical protein
MRTLLILTGCLLLAPAALAQPRPAKLSPEEVKEGWLQLFDGETSFGWHVSGEARVEKGVLVLGGKRATHAHFSTFFAEMQSELEVQVLGKEDVEVALIDEDGEEVVVNELEPNGKANGREPNRDEKKWTLVRARVWSIPELEKTGVSLTREHPKEVPVGRGTVSKRPLPTTTMVFSIPAGVTLNIRSARLLPGKMTSLFNGKDLTGWKVHPNKKSRFTVTTEGWLNIKDGPGDIQTVGKWSDFVFQCECISHGKHLNSGVFFRCRPGEYQQGYEAQIRNQFNSKADQEYTIEEYHWNTHELVDKRKLLSPAVDYGTGGIYRRIPARKEVAKDQEWFTLTVVARGRHIATWVNGIQQVSWKDNRPSADNARKGCYLKAGPISLQGHDPTTNLSFRNLRVGPLSGAE